MKLRPETLSPTIAMLPRGHKLIKISEQGTWIEVGAEKTGGKIGWITRSEASTEKPQGPVKSYTTSEFDKFEKAVWKLEQNATKGGLVFFTAVEYLGDGMVKSTSATPGWTLQ